MKKIISLAVVCLSLLFSISIVVSAYSSYTIGLVGQNACHASAFICAAELNFPSWQPNWPANLCGIGVTNITGVATNCGPEIIDMYGNCGRLCTGALRYDGHILSQSSCNMSAGYPRYTCEFNSGNSASDCGYPLNYSGQAWVLGCAAPIPGNTLSMTISPPTQSVNVGGPAVFYNVNIQNTYTGTLNLSLSNCPSGATCTLNSNSLSFIADSSDDSRNVTLTVTPSGASAGIYSNITVTGVIGANSATAVAQLSITNPVIALGAQCVSINVPYNLYAGQNYRVSVAMKNTGTEVWRPFNGGSNMIRVRVANSNDIPAVYNPALYGNFWENNSYGITNIDVTQNNTFMFNFTGTIPASAPVGAKRLGIRMVKEGAGGGWFGDVCTANVNIVAPTNPTVSIDLPTTGSNHSTPVRIAGWAIDNMSIANPPKIKKVEIFEGATKLAGSDVGTLTYGGNRPDVCSITSRASCPTTLNAGYDGFFWDITSPAVANGSHTITVKATDEADRSTSVTRQFNVTKPLVAPVMNAPVCNAAGTQVTLSWGTVAGVENFQNRLNDGTNDSPACLYGWLCDATTEYAEQLPKTTLTKTYNIKPNKLYGWWIHANDILGQWGASNTVFFTCAPTVAPAPDLKITSWMNWAGNTRDTVWNYNQVNGPIEVYHGATYAVSWGAVANATSCTLDGVNVATSATTVNTYTALLNSKTHTLRCTGPGGIVNDSVTITVPPLPTNLTRTCNGTGTQMTLNWALPVGYTSSYLRVGVGTDNWTPNALSEDIVGATRTLTVTPGQTYHVWVHTKNSSNGAWGNLIQNNFSCSALAQPNLTAGPVTPTTATVGTALPFTSTITNNGGSSTGVVFPNHFQVRNSSNVISTISALNTTSALASGGAVSVNSSNYTFPSSGSYSVRACADNNASMVGVIPESNEGDNCGAWTPINVIVSATIPTLGPPTKSSVTSTSAVLGSTILSDGGSAIIARGTCWGWAASPNLSNSSCLVESGTSVGVPFSHIRTGMNPNASYNYTAYATNAIGTGYSDVGSFVTIVLSAVANIRADPPSIPYNTASNIIWFSNNATSCAVTPPNNWTGLSGSESTGNLTASRTYTIACNPVGPNSSASATVTVPPQPKTLNVIKSGQGAVTGVSVPIQTNINCGSVCSRGYSSGTIVTLTASPATGRIFTGWGILGGGSCPGKGVCVVTMDNGKTVTANFAIDPNYQEF